MIDLAPWWPTIVRRARLRTEARRAQRLDPMTRSCYNPLGRASGRKPDRTIALPRDRVAARSAIRAGHSDSEGVAWTRCPLVRSS